MDEIINFYNHMPTIIKIIIIVFGLGIVFSIIKKFLKAAILFAVLIILIIVILKLINGV